MSKHTSFDFYTYAEKERQYSLLSEAEIKELFKKKNKEMAMQTIITRSLRLVCKYVFEWRSFALRTGLQLEDLTGAGNIGLILGVSRFSARKGYFYKHIRRYIRAYIFNEVFSGGYPRRVALKKMKLHENINPTVSLEETLSDNGDDGPITLKDVIASKEDRDAHITLDVNNLLTALRKDHKITNKLAKDIVELRYGVGSRKNSKPLSFAETAKILNLSKEGVRKIENKTISYLKSL